MSRFTHATQSHQRQDGMASAKRLRRGPERGLGRGFTLLEVIVVVVIIALLATLVAPRVFDNIGRSNARIARAEVESIAQQVHLYLVDNGMSRIPNDFRLQQLTEGDRPYLRPRDLIDPWGNEYVIRIPGEVNPDFDIISYGASGEPGGEGEDADIIHGD